MENGLRIKKVKNVESVHKIIVEYERVKNGRCEVVTLVSDDPADADFYHAFKALKESVCGILEINSIDFADRVTPYGVTFKYDKSDVMGAIISAKFDLPDAGTSIALNTPMRKCLPDEKTDGLFFTETTTNLLWELESEARKYVSGKRAQMSLFGEEVNEAEDESEADPMMSNWTTQEAAQVIDFPEAATR